MRTTVRFWKEVAPLLVRVLRESGLGLNRLVNEAVLLWLNGSSVEQLRLRARLVVLQKEEEGLRQSMRVMLRSGSFLPKYAKQLFREPGRPIGFIRDGQVPLKALNPKEEDVARRILAERERIAQEIADVLRKLLPEKRFRLKPECSQSRKRLHDKSAATEVKN